MKKMTLYQHMSELRHRILWCAVIFLASFVAGWYMSPFLHQILARPLMRVWADGTMLYTGITDGLMIRLSLASMFALVLTMPAVLWNLWAFVSPGLKRNERNIVWPIVVASPILFCVGVAFAYFVLFPFAFKFFIELNDASPVNAMMLPAARDYLGLAVGMLKMFGVAFQLPLFLVLLNRVGLLSRARVVKMRRYAIVAIVVAAAVLTPPDVVSQVLLALPLWALFEISILFMLNRE